MNSGFGPDCNNCGCNCQSCCTYPHGGASMWLTLTAVTAYVLCVNASYGCDYVRVDLTSGDDTGKIPAEKDVGFGLFTWENKLEGDDGYYKACYVWDYETVDMFFDGAWKAARALGILANVCLGIPMIASVLLVCMSYGRDLRNTLAILLLIGSISIGSTFIVYTSDVCSQFACQFSNGGYMAMASCVLAFISAVLMSKLPDGDADYAPPRGQYAGGTAAVVANAETVAVTESVAPDGTRTIIKTTTHPDGSKTVEETVEKPTASAW